MKNRFSLTEAKVVSPAWRRWVSNTTQEIKAPSGAALFCPPKAGTAPNGAHGLFRSITQRFRAGLITFASATLGIGRLSPLSGPARSRRDRICRRICATLLLLMLPIPVFAQYQQAVPGYRYQFPRDHFDHPDYKTEWWYYTGNVKSADGHRFGFELTFFRQAVSRADEPRSDWEVRDLYLAHLTLSDIYGNRFYHTERLNRAGPGHSRRESTSGESVEWQLAGTVAERRATPAGNCRQLRPRFRFTLRQAAGNSRQRRHQPQRGREWQCLALHLIHPLAGGGHCHTQWYILQCGRNVMDGPRVLQQRPRPG